MAKNWRFYVALLAILVAFTRRFILTTTEDGKIPRDFENRLQRSEIIETSEFFIGPESLAFDPQGKGPYVGVADGRIMVWDEAKRSWSYFAHTSPRRSDICNPGSPPVLKIELEHICGRPLGLKFDKKGDLYIADAYFGFHVVGPEGGLSKPLVTEAEGVPLAFTNDLEFTDDGLIYFTDSSSKYNRRDFVSMFMGGDETGRLLTFNPSTGETKVVLNGLQFPNGLAISQDNSYLVMSETLTFRVLRYWLTGPKAGQLEVFAHVPGYPDNIRRAKNGDFWVAIHAQPNPLLKLPIPFRRALLKLPISFTGIYTKVVRRIAKGMIIRLSSDGNVLDVVEDQEGKVVRLVSEVEERDGKLWMGSVILPQIAVYKE